MNNNTTMPRLNFYDVKDKKKFSTDDYKLRTINCPSGKRKQAVAISPGGTKSVRFVPADFKK